MGDWTEDQKNEFDLKLERNRTELVNNIVLTGLFDKLRDKGVLTPRIVEYIKNTGDSYEQKGELLNIILKKPISGKLLFCEALKETENGWLVDEYLTPDNVTRVHAHAESTSCLNNTSTPMSTQHVLLDISRGLSDDDVKYIQFLSNLKESNALEIFEKMKQEMKICRGNFKFLRDILNLIGHKVLSNKLPDDTCSTEDQVHIDDIVKIHYSIAVQLKKEDIDEIKFLLEVPGQEKERIQDGIDLMLFVKKQNRISELKNYLGTIERIDLASKLVISKEPPALPMHSGDELQSGENTTVDYDVRRHGPQGDGNQHAADTDPSETELVIASERRKIPHTANLVDNKLQENKPSQTKQFDVLLLSTENDINEVQEFKEKYLDDIRLTDGCQVKFCVFQEEGGQFQDFDQRLEKCSGVLLFLSRSFTTNKIMKRCSYTAYQVYVESTRDFLRTVYLDPKFVIPNLPPTISSIDPGFKLPLDGNHSDRLIQWIESLHQYREDHVPSNMKMYVNLNDDFKLNSSPCDSTKRPEEHAEMIASSESMKYRPPSKLLMDNAGTTSSNAVISNEEPTDESDFGTVAPGDTPYPHQEHDSLFSGQNQFGVASAENIKQYILFSSNEKTPHQSKFIDKGRFGFVYEGIKTYRGYKVAVKVSSCGDNATERQFEQEKVLADLNHPFILPILNTAKSADNEIFYIMYPFMANKDLGRVMCLENHEPDKTDLTQERCLRISAQVASAMDYLHSHKSSIVHRDIKPGNILLDEKFNSRLSDTGLARSIPSGQSFVRPTACVGTEGYLDQFAFNMAKGEASYRPVNDIFSFGVVMLQLVVFRSAVLSNQESKNLSKPKKSVSYLWQKYGLSNKKPEVNKKLIVLNSHKIWKSTDSKMLNDFVGLTSKCLQPDLEKRLSASELYSKLQELLIKYGVPSYECFSKDEISSKNNCFVCLKQEPNKHLKSKCEDTGCSEMLICKECMSGWRCKKLFCPVHGHTEPPVGHSRCFAIVVSGKDERDSVSEIFAHDANTVADVFKDPEIGGMRPENVHRIDATKETNMLKALQDMFKDVKKNSTDYSKDDTRLVFYYSGHAGRTGLGVDPSVSYTELQQLLRNIDANETLLVLDCCHAGTDVLSKTDNTQTVFDILKQLKDFRNVEIGNESVSKSGRSSYTGQLSSCLHNQESQAFTFDHLSLFTKHFVEALRGGYVCLSKNSENRQCHVCKDHEQGSKSKGFTLLEEVFYYVVEHVKLESTNGQTPFHYSAKTEDLRCAWYPYRQEERMYPLLVTKHMDGNRVEDPIECEYSLFQDNCQLATTLNDVLSILKENCDDEEEFEYLQFLPDKSSIMNRTTKKELTTVRQINQSLRNGHKVEFILNFLCAISVYLSGGTEEHIAFKLQPLLEIKRQVLQTTKGKWPDGVQVNHLQIIDDLGDKELETMDELKDAIRESHSKIVCKLRDNIVDILNGPVILEKFNKEDMDIIIEEVFGNKESDDDSVSKGFHGSLKWCGRIITVAGTAQLNQFFSKTVEEFNKRRGLDKPIENVSSAINDVVDGMISTAREAGRDAAQGLEQRPSFDIHVTDLGGAVIEIKSVRIQNEP